ncbi:uncharacterized protein TNCV_2918711 [Trichonephila clavipes]|nr:uncharacterized protein TNCV_2918711 [Trichonephila clavipes]
MGAECEVAGRYDRHSGSNSLSNVFLDSGGKKMSSNIFWIPEEDEILIDFVRNHELLYNIRHPDYRKAQAKQHLWESYDCCKRWGYVRDYYIRRRGKPGSGSSGIAAKKRSELLSFLDSFAVSQRTTTTNVGSSQGLSDVTQLSSTEPDFDSGPEILDPDSNDYFGKMEEEKFQAPTKFLALSDDIVAHFPRLATKRFNVARKASVVKSETISRWTAFEAKQTKMATYIFW